MNHTLNQWQLFLLTVSFLVGSSLLMAPNLTSYYSKQDAWLSMIIAIAIGIFINLLWIYLLSLYQYQSIFEIVETVSGKWIGSILSLIIVFYSLHLCSYVVRNVSNFMISSVLPDTNAWTFQIMLILVSLYSCYYGLNNIARVNEFLNPIMAVLFIASLILTLNRFDIRYFKPVLEQPLSTVMQGAYTTTGFPFIEVILLGTVFTYVRKKKKLMRSYLNAIVASGIILLITIIVAIGCDGYYMVSRTTFPTFELMRAINIVKLLERVEVLIAVVWIVGIFVKIVICFLAAMMGLQQVAKHHSYGPFLLPAGLLVWAMSNHEHSNTMEFTDFVAKNWTLWWFTLYFLLIVVLIIGVILKKNKRTDT
ncbi:spore germination protein [Fictibacillus sp. KIGAM418]|uniref:Spore germination protein n=1 Tax=Fictibacillus marinisediminis TaxID=2878389 RepID=A0A9X1XAG1_9BACL|nr:endospore germination permease [Fictibacillus marinisediminis]MCK6256576.1 spore germination protein [Fictibacillus marinisediminis]